MKIIRTFYLPSFCCVCIKTERKGVHNEVGFLSSLTARSVVFTSFLHNTRILAMSQDNTRFFRFLRTDLHQEILWSFFKKYTLYRYYREKYEVESLDSSGKIIVFFLETGKTLLTRATFLLKMFLQRSLQMWQQLIFVKKWTSQCHSFSHGFFT